MNMTPRVELVFLVSCLLSEIPAQKVHLVSSSPDDGEHKFISAHVGETLSLTCPSKTDDLKWASWYKQELGQKPKLISTFSRYSDDSKISDGFKNDVRFVLKIDKQSVKLTISDLNDSDSATYYCTLITVVDLKFVAVVTVIVIGSGLTFQTPVSPPFFSLPLQNSVTLNCTVHTGSCDDGGHRVYWFRDSEDSRPGLIYTHGGNKEECERNTNSPTHSCVYKLPLEKLDESQAGTYYCAVASCGHILFGNGNKVYAPGEDHTLLIILLSGALTFLSFVILLLILRLHKLEKRSRRHKSDKRSSTVATTTTEVESRDPDSLHYAALSMKQTNRSRRQRNDTDVDCVYSNVAERNAVVE